jgi:hypothetical protein
MAPQFLQVDRHALLRLAHLVDLAHWCPGDVKLEETIARMEQRFGLTPLDRRRLDWKIDEPPRSVSSARSQREAERIDPRGVLRAVQ